MRLPKYEDKITPASTPAGLAMQEALMNQIAPYFVEAMQTGALQDPDNYAMAHLLFDQDNPMIQMLALTRMDGEVLTLTPADTSPVWAYAVDVGGLPEPWEAFMARHRWYMAWQLKIGGPPCEASKEMDQ